jgi:hypothetical protein
MHFSSKVVEPGAKAISAGMKNIRVPALAIIAIWSLYHSISVIVDPGEVPGWDTDVVCGALRAILHGADPYLVGNLGGARFSYAYLPHVAFLSSPICLASTASMFYAWFYLALVIGSITLMMRWLDRGWLESCLWGCLAPGMFSMSKWLTLTGNPGVLDLPFLAAAVVAFYRKRFLLSASLFGFMASIKLVPLIGLLAYALLLPVPLAIQSVAAGVGVFGATAALNLIFMGALRQNFMLQLVGGIPGQHQVLTENSGTVELGWADPNLNDFSANLFSSLGIHHRTLFVTAISLGAMMLGFLLRGLRARCFGQQGMLFETRIYCFALLVVQLLLFRLKPYAYADLALLALVCCVGVRSAADWTVAALGCIIPVVTLLLPPESLDLVFISYTQMVSLLCALVAIIILLSLEQRAVGLEIR